MSEWLISNRGFPMPTKSKKEAPVARARLPEGKKQMLVIMDQDVILDVKMAALQDGIKMSHAVEEAVTDWLAKRKAKRNAK
jgi:hypothetical protein